MVILNEGECKYEIHIVDDEYVQQIHNAGKFFLSRNENIPETFSKNRR